MPLNAFSHFPEAGIKTPHETLKQVNLDTTVTFLSTLLNPSDSSITTLVLEPCLTHISSLSFRECVALVHSARKSISKPVRFEVRMSLPSPKVLSYCRMHSDAPRVCFTCFAQTLDPSVTECGACSPPRACNPTQPQHRLNPTSLTKVAGSKSPPRRSNLRCCASLTTSVPSSINCTIMHARSPLWRLR